jgi:hypothetical protein
LVLFDGNRESINEPVERTLFGHPYFGVKLDRIGSANFKSNQIKSDQINADI